MHGLTGDHGDHVMPRAGQEHSIDIVLVRVTVDLAQDQARIHRTAMLVLRDMNFVNYNNYTASLAMVGWNDAYDVSLLLC